MRISALFAVVLFVWVLPFGALHLATLGATLLVVIAAFALWQRFDVRHLFFVYERRWMFATLAAFLFFVTISFAFASSLSLAFFSAGRLVLAIAVGGAVAYLIGQGLVAFAVVLGTIVAGALFQSVVAFFQFATQSSLGLWWLGESVLAPNASGVAKIVVDGVRFIRAYGTFPHPNVLAAFLLIGFLAATYFFLVRCGRFPNPYISDDRLRCTDLFLVASQFIIFLGLLLTFSRAAWIVGAFAVVMIFWWAFRQRELHAFAIRYAVVVVASALLLFGIFYPFIFSRASFVLDEPAVADRFVYLRLGARIVADRPLGVGIGNQTLFANERGLYDEVGLTNAWQKEPVHNLYLLMASEIGVGGLLAFLTLLFTSFKFQSSTSNKSLNFNPQFFATAIMLGALLLFGLTDHFLWDIQQGRLLLWLTMGILMGVSVRSSTDRMHPSEG